MSWNYRKRIKIAPGIHINISKSGMSTSIGPKGMKLNTSKKGGTYLNSSIPGTGLYSRNKISSSDSSGLGCIIWGILLIIMLLIII